MQSNKSNQNLLINKIINLVCFFFWKFVNNNLISNQSKAENKNKWLESIFKSCFISTILLKIKIAVYLIFLLVLFICTFYLELYSYNFLLSISVYLLLIIIKD